MLGVVANFGESSDCKQILTDLPCLCTQISTDVKPYSQRSQRYVK